MYNINHVHVRHDVRTARSNKIIRLVCKKVNKISVSNLNMLIVKTIVYCTYTVRDYEYLIIIVISHTSMYLGHGINVYIEAGWLCHAFSNVDVSLAIIYSLILIISSLILILASCFLHFLLTSCSSSEEPGSMCDKHSNLRSLWQNTCRMSAENRPSGCRPGFIAVVHWGDPGRLS